MFALLLLLAESADPAIARQANEAALREVGLSSYRGEHLEAEATAKGLAAVRAEATTTRASWDSCVQKFADNASEVEIDPGSEVVRTALLACETEQGRAVWAWAMQSFLASSFKPSGATSYQWAKDAYAEFAASKADALLVRVSYNRQLAHLRREREAIEREQRALRLQRP